MNVEFKNEVIDIELLFPKLWTVLNSKVLTSTVQHSASRAHELEPSVHSPASRVQRPEFRVQHPESSVQLLRPESRNSGMPSKSTMGHNFYNTDSVEWPTNMNNEDNIAESLGNIHNIVKSLENKVIAYVKISTKFFFQIWKTQQTPK